MNTLGSFQCYKSLTCEPGYALTDGECTGENALRPSLASVPQGWSLPLSLPPHSCIWLPCHLPLAFLPPAGLYASLSPPCDSVPCLRVEMEPHRRLLMFLSLGNSSLLKRSFFLSILSISQISFNARRGSGYQKHWCAVTFLCPSYRGRREYRGGRVAMGGGRVCL